MTYAAKILADSVSPFGHRLVSIEWTFPRFILAEVNTHRQLTKSSASSRAIPVAKRLAMIRAEPFIPEAFGKNQKGMQAGELLAEAENAAAKELWHEAMQSAIGFAEKFAELGVHKQYANRLTELFSWHTAVVTGTEWENFEALRISSAAQPEFYQAAVVLRDAKAASTPVLLQPGEWHLPYVQPEEQNGDWPKLVKLSCGRAARVSYLTQDGLRDLDADLGLYQRLASMGHMAPLEHAARPMTSSEREEAAMHEFVYRSTHTGERPLLVTRLRADNAEKFRRIRKADIVSERVTYFCGNFNGWVQHRKELPGEAIFGTAPM